MTKMFYGTSFNQPLNNWNVSNLPYMSCMFDTAESFNIQENAPWYDSDHEYESDAESNDKSDDESNDESIR